MRAGLTVGRGLPFRPSFCALYRATSERPASNAPLLTKRLPDGTANNDELRACAEAGIDLFVLEADRMTDVCEIASTHFTGAGSM